MIEYYTRVAPALLPHLFGRAVTLRRYPEGVHGPSFFEKRCPSHAPSFVPRVDFPASSTPGKSIRFCSVADLAGLVWMANMAALELHPSLSLAAAPDRPTVLVFDLDPGAPATVVECAQVALWLRAHLETLELEGFPKTSGSKGLQVYVPLHTETDFDTTKALAHALALVLEREHPELVVSRMTTSLRAGKVFVDWGQNDRHKTTVSVYSLRARDTPTASTPVTWAEVEEAVASHARSRDDPGGPLRFHADAVVSRVASEGDLFEPVTRLRQHVPDAVVRQLRRLADS